MKFPINKKLSIHQRFGLIEALEVVAKKYFSDEYICTDCGICAAVGYQYIEDADYLTMGRLMREILEEDSILGEYTDTREEWEARANMCLFLVEYLKDTVD